MATGLIHSSGGLVYHWRAWRHASTLWRGYLDTVANWLDAWRPGRDELVLVGPSAGYSLSERFLRRFRTITVMEPDPLACRLLAFRFRPIRFDFIPAMASPDELRMKHPHAAYLFCNVLGQHWGAGNDWHAAFASAMDGQTWASYHDLISTPVTPHAHGPIELPESPTLEDIAGRFWRGSELAVTDHGTQGLLPRLPRKYIVWSLTPRQHHLVEWLSV